MMHIYYLPLLVTLALGIVAYFRRKATSPLTDAALLVLALVTVAMAAMPVHVALRVGYVLMGLAIGSVGLRDGIVRRRERRPRTH